MSRKLTEQIPHPAAGHEKKRQKSRHIRSVEVLLLPLTPKHGFPSLSQIFLPGQRALPLQPPFPKADQPLLLCSRICFLIGNKVSYQTKKTPPGHTRRRSHHLLCVLPPLALPKSGTVEDPSSSQPVTQAPAHVFNTKYLTTLLRACQILFGSVFCPILPARLHWPPAGYSSHRQDSCQKSLTALPGASSGAQQHTAPFPWLPSQWPAEALPAPGG